MRNYLRQVASGVVFHVFLQPTALRLDPDAYLTLDTQEVLLRELKGILRHLQKSPEVIHIDRLLPRWPPCRH